MKNRNEIVASKLYDLLADMRTDTDRVGRYFAQQAEATIYKKFEEVVESARHEKDIRIEWIKDIILGDSNMATTLDNKCVILVQLWYGYFDVDEFSDFLNEHAIAIATARAYTEGAVSDLTGYGSMIVDKAFADLLSYLEVEDTGFEALSDFYVPVIYDNEF